jgi:hypothetical protein
MDSLSLRRLTPPTPTLSRINQILEYSSQRRAYFTYVIRARFPDIEKKITQITANLVQNDLNQFEKSRIELGITASWGELANELAAREATVFRDEKSKSPVGSRVKLRGRYDYYQEILSHKGKCANINLAVPGPYRSGCVILKPMFTDAEEFFSKSAWIDMDLTLLNASFSAPKELAGLIQKLKELRVHKDEGLLKPELILKAVNIHDQLLEEWVAIIEGNSHIVTSEATSIEGAL